MTTRPLPPERSEAERLGVAIGDRLVRVDGYEAGAHTRRVRGGSSFPFLLVGGGGLKGQVEGAEMRMLNSGFPQGQKKAG